MENSSTIMHNYRKELKKDIGPEGKTTRARLVRHGHCSRREFDVNWQAKELTPDIEIFFDGLLEKI